MKTAISVPDEVFDQASARAKSLGMSRSEFFATVASRYLAQLDAQSATQEIGIALTHLGDDSSGDGAVAAWHQVLADGDDW